MTNTKELILRRATLFFNDRGVSTTSLRQVAAYLEMSDGNLRYHYKNKEELVLAIFHHMLQDMEEVINRGEQETTAVLEEIRKKFRGIFRIMYHYKFLFIESPLLLRSYPPFQVAFLQLFEARKSFFSGFFQEYIKKGFFREDMEKGFFERTFEQIFIISDNWIKYLELEVADDFSVEGKIDHYINLCMSLLLPAISEDIKKCTKL